MTTSTSVVTGLQLEAVTSCTYQTWRSVSSVSEYVNIRWQGRYTMLFDTAAYARGLAEQILRYLNMQHNVWLLPAGEELQGWSAEELVGEEINFLHDVGQSDRKLLAQEHKGGLLTCISRAWNHMEEIERRKHISQRSTLTPFWQKRRENGISFKHCESEVF